MRVLLVGGGPQEAALKAQAQDLGVADNVVFTGRVPHAEVQRYYDLIDVLAYPRHSMRLTELVTPLKPLEAMAQGRLLVASDVGGHKELIHHGETGWLFKAGSAPALAAAVEQLLAQREQWPGLRRAGREFVERERNWAASVARKPAYARLADRQGCSQAIVSDADKPDAGPHIVVFSSQFPSRAPCGAVHPAWGCLGGQCLPFPRRR
jgi:glycosyltransferase involved in cell wall biosynthesis